jgi:hypothetical protein
MKPPINHTAINSSFVVVMTDLSGGPSELATAVGVQQKCEDSFAEGIRSLELLVADC